MKWTRTIIAALVLGVTMLLSVLDRTLTRTRLIDKVAQASLADGVNLSAVNEIVVRNTQGEVTLTKAATDDWRAKGDKLDAPADLESVEQLLTNVTGAKRTNEIDAPSLAEYGLASPDAEVTFKQPTAPREFKVQVGNESTYTGLVFARYADGTKVFTVAQYVKSVMMRAPQDWRRLRLVDTGDPETYTAISVEGKDGQLTLKADAGKWTMESAGATQPADADLVREYIRKLGVLRAGGFVNPATDRPTTFTLATAALTSPTLTVTLARAGAGPQTISVAIVEGIDGQVVVARRGSESEILYLRGETLEELRADVTAFRGRELFSLKPADVARFSIRLGNSVTDLLRTPKGFWEFEGDSGRLVDQESVDTRLDQLLKSRAKQYIDASPADGGAGYGIPRFTFTVADRNGTRRETVETGNPEKGQLGSVYARRRGDPAVFTMDLTKDLLITPDQVSDRRFARVAVENVARLEAEFDGQKHLLKLENGDWRILRDGQTEYASEDNRKVTRILGLMNTMTYEKDFAASGEKVISPPVTQPIVLRAFDARGGVQMILTFGRRSADRTFVAVGGTRLFEVKTLDADRLVAAIRALP